MQRRSVTDLGDDLIAKVVYTVQWVRRKEIDSSCIVFAIQLWLRHQFRRNRWLPDSMVPTNGWPASSNSTTSSGSVQLLFSVNTSPLPQSTAAVYLRLPKRFSLVGRIATALLTVPWFNLSKRCRGTDGTNGMSSGNRRTWVCHGWAPTFLTLRYIEGRWPTL